MSAIESMTGFASVDGAVDGGRSFTLSVKAVNHRHLDLSVRLPGGMDALDAPLRKAVKASVRRGHVELTLMLERVQAAVKVEVDEALLGAYVGAFRRAAASFGLAAQPDLNGLFKMPGVVSSTVVPVDVAAMEAPVLAAASQLLDRFHAARRAEGEALAAELRASMARLAAYADEARALRSGVAAAEFAKLAARLKELVAGEVSEDRLLTEAALLAARSDVEEELVRLRTHIERFVELLDAGGEVGRALDFLLQELNREANTMLSKTGGNAGDGGLRLTEIGLAVKVELERAREQVQNLE